MEGLDTVKQSYGRACLNPNLIERFYTIFLESHPDIKPRFRNTDFTKQRQLLKTGVIIMLGHLEGKSVWTEHLNKIAEKHSKQHLNIPPALYQYWIDSLICAVKEYDAQWTPEIERSWKKVLRAGVDSITEYYEKP